MKRSGDHEEKVAIGIVIAIFLFQVLVSLGVLGLIVWAVIELVQWVVSK